MKCTKCRAETNPNGTPIKWYECTACHTKRTSAYNKKNKSKVWARTKKWREENPEKHRATSRRFRVKLRAEMLVAYGGINPKCACCGENLQEFLSLDHINNDGSKEKYAGTGFYVSLRAKKWPQNGYQILCYNCNMAKAFFKICPHKRASTEYST